MAKERPVVAVDFDDIVAGFNMAYHQWHNEHYGTAFAYHDLVTFDMCALYGVDTQTLSTRVNSFVHEHHDLILPIEGAEEGLRRLAEVCDLHIVTSRCESLTEVTTGWSRSRALEHFTAYHFTNGFNSLFPERKRRKLDVCRQIQAIALVDDADHNAIEVAENGIPVFMLERPWNGNMPHTLVTRLPSWNEIADAILKII